MAAALWAAACGGNGDDESSADSLASTSTSIAASTTSAAGDDSTTTAADVPSTTAQEATTTEFETVTSEVTGTAVGGNNGGVGGSEQFSETIRNEDGTCTGWDGATGGLWTQGLEAGAPVTFLGRESDDVLGEGSIVSSFWEDADPSDENTQWQCTFAFSGTITGTPESFRIRVAGLNPWVVFPDPAEPGSFIASVDSSKEPGLVDACADQEPGLEEVFDWSPVVGRYWSSAYGSLCSDGLTIAGFESECRPRGFGSDHVIRVTSAADPNRVLEDQSGVLVDVAELEPYTPVIVHIAIGRPCT